MSCRSRQAEWYGAHSKGETHVFAVGSLGGK